MKKIADFSDRIWYSVDKIKDLRDSGKCFEILVSWKGLTAAGDFWEPLDIMFEDVPSRVRAYFRRRRLNDVINEPGLLSHSNRKPWRNVSHQQLLASGCYLAFLLENKLLGMILILHMVEFYSGECITRWFLLFSCCSRMSI